MARVAYHDRVGMVIKKAMSQGDIVKTEHGIRYQWDVAGPCLNPVGVEYYGRPSAPHGARYIRVAKGRSTPLLLELSVPCRKCVECQKRRRSMWVARACHEVREAHRTWFATITLNPQAHYVMRARAAMRARDRSIPAPEVVGVELDRRQTQETFSEITKWIKRVRKQTGSHSLRYIIVKEDHENGNPHFHALIHEVGETPVTHKILSDQWKLGFTKFKLLENEKAAYYVVKYLTKANDGRVRASLGYGRVRPKSPPKAIANEVKRELRSERPAAEGRRELTQDVTRGADTHVDALLFTRSEQSEQEVQ